MLLSAEVHPRAPLNTTHSAFRRGRPEPQHPYAASWVRSRANKPTASLLSRVFRCISASLLLYIHSQPTLAPPSLQSHPICILLFIFPGTPTQAPAGLWGMPRKLETRRQQSSEMMPNTSSSTGVRPQFNDRRAARQFSRSTNCEDQLRHRKPKHSALLPMPGIWPGANIDPLNGMQGRGVSPTHPPTRPH